MLLRELTAGQKFMFEDRRTPLAYAGKHGNYNSMGTFQYVGVGENGCPKLLHIEQNKALTVVPGTYYRSVLIILN